jgi:hypothetical protein
MWRRAPSRLAARQCSAHTSDEARDVRGDRDACAGKPCCAAQQLRAAIRQELRYSKCTRDSRRETEGSDAKEEDGTERGGAVPERELQ